MQFSKPSKKNCFQRQSTITANHEIKLTTKSKQTIRGTNSALNHRQQTELFKILPWHLNAPSSCNIYCSVPGITSRADNISCKTRMSTERIDNHHADYIIYTHGSTTLGSKDSRLAVVITQGLASNPTTIDAIKERGIVFTCSFQEELADLSTDLHWTKDNNPTIGKTVNLTVNFYVKSY